jgi:hypothetical protein
LWRPPNVSAYLLAVSDVVSLHCPLIDETREMINAAAIAQMKRDAISSTQLAAERDENGTVAPGAGHPRFRFSTQRSVTLW